MFKIIITPEQCLEVRKILAIQNKYRYYQSVESIIWIPNSGPHLGGCFKIKGVEIISISISKYETVNIYSHEFVFEYLHNWIKPYIREYNLEQLIQK
jgi:hypothetical protein